MQDVLVVSLICSLVSDYKTGFGGKFGVQTDRVDKSALGWEHHEKVNKHESQKGINFDIVFIYVYCILQYTVYLYLSLLAYFFSFVALSRLQNRLRRKVWSTE